MSRTKTVDTRAAWLVLIATSANVVLVFINATSLVIIMPVVARDFEATPAEATWFILSYQLVLTGFIIVFGRLADIFGRKALYVFGVGIFALASGAGGLVESVELFIAARLIQGFGAAAIISNTTAILTDVFPTARMPAALGLNATSAALGQVLGPVVGGVTSEFMDWRIIFLATAGLSAFSLLFSWKLVPGRGSREKERVDVLGALTLAGSLGLFVAGMSEGSSTGWDHPRPVIMLGVAAVVFGIFVLVQKHVQTPLMDLGLFRVPRLGRRYVAVFLCGCSHYAVILLISIYLQAVEQLTAFEVSLIAIASPLATMVAAQAAGRLVSRLPVGLLASAGMLLIGTAAGVLILLLGGGADNVWICVPLVLLGLGIGMFMTPNTSLIMYITPVDQRGVSNGIRSTALNLGFLVTTAASLAIATSTLGSSARDSVYMGDYPLSASASQDFTWGVQLALAVLLVTAAVGAVLSAGKDRIARSTKATSKRAPTTNESEKSLAGGNYVRQHSH